MTPDETSDREILVTRTVDAPRELVWRAMTDLEQVGTWWGPRGFTTTTSRMEVRPGGEWVHVMHGPDGVDYPNHCNFLDVVRPERLVFTNSGAKQDGPEVVFVATWTFEALNAGRTVVTIRMVFPTQAARDTVVRDFGALEGAHQTLERLNERLPRMGVAFRDVVITRVIAAPVDVVFRAWTDPAQLQQWWGPAGFSNPVCEADARVGGSWRIVMRAPYGTDYPCHGVYREIVPNRRLVFTNMATDDAGTPVLDGLTSVDFAEQDGTTTVTVQTSAMALVDYAADFLKGMEIGWQQSLARLIAAVGTTGSHGG